MPNFRRKGISGTGHEARGTRVLVTSAVIYTLGIIVAIP